jgi:predicted amidohydrolase YtcJ
MGLPSRPDAEEIDLSGYTVIPGLIDAHVHVTAIDFNLTNMRFAESEVAIQNDKITDRQYYSKEEICAIVEEAADRDLYVMLWRMPILQRQSLGVLNAGSAQLSMEIY